MMRHHTCFSRGRTRRTKAQIRQLNRQLVEVLERERPLSLRRVFLRMTDPSLPEPVEKSERGYRQVLNRLVRLREERRDLYHRINEALDGGVDQ